MYVDRPWVQLSVLKEVKDANRRKKQVEIMWAIAYSYHTARKLSIKYQPVITEQMCELIPGLSCSILPTSIVHALMIYLIPRSLGTRSFQYTLRQMCKPVSSRAYSVTVLL